MPPTVQDILNQTRPGHPMVGRPFDPLAGMDPLAPLPMPVGGINVNSMIPGARLDPVVQPGHLPPPQEFPKIDPKLFVNMPPSSALKDFEAKLPAKAGGGGPPAWLRWEYAVGLLLVAALAGLLRGLFSRKASAQ
jgi:hypothetical protein